MRATVAALAPRLRADRVSVAVEGPEHVTVRADHEKIRQVLINLIDNAADALREAPGDRRVAIAVARANGTEIELPLT